MTDASTANGKTERAGGKPERANGKAERAGGGQLAPSPGRRGRLPASVAAVRTAVKRALADVPPDGLVVVACSGGADSLALATAAAHVAPRLGLRVGLVTVDHGLQSGSGSRAEELAAWAASAGLAPSLAVPATVDGRPGGPEAAAREARYEALAEAARSLSAAAVLLGHTRDDQAETVLLALARGSGPRGIAGMPERRELHGVTFLRPLLDISRERTRDVCVRAGLTPWEDPHNSDPSYARSRLRSALALLCDLLGPDVVDNLARTARLVAQDAVALDDMAVSAAWPLTDPDGGLHVPALRELPDALRTRVLRGFALRLGASGGALSSRHIEALDALVTDWRGQGPVALPGGHRATRDGKRLVAVADPPWSEPAVVE
jgi:tRNA(Ile)-lysidine synthase